MNPDPLHVDDIEALAPMVLGGYFTMPPNVSGEEEHYGTLSIRTSIATGRPLVLRDGWKWHSFAERSSKAWLLLALGVGAALGFVAGMALR